MLLDLFLIGLVVTLEPIPLTAMILLLAAERGILEGPGIHARVVVDPGGHRGRHGPGHRRQAARPPERAVDGRADCVKLAVGVVLVFIGYRRWGKPAATEPKKQPRWMASIDRINPLAAAGLGFLLQPWVLVAAGVATITEAKLSSGLEYLAVFAFCVWCTASYLVLEIYATFRPQVVKAKLNALLEWINTHRDQAIVFLSLGLGLYLMAKSIYSLVSGG